MTLAPARAAFAALALLAALGLATRDVWPPDETRYADVARAMRAGEGWIVPHLHGETYGEKPPVFFWATAALDAMGVPLGAAPRAVSALAALATLALLPGIGRRLGRSERPSALAPLVLATSPLFLAYALVGLLDAASTALVTAAIAAKLGREDGSRAARVGLTLLEGAVIGLALLTKGPVLLLFPLGLRVGAGVRHDGRRHPAAFAASDLVVLAIAAGIAAAWLLAAASVAGGEYAHAITLGQAARRVTGDAPHLRPPGFLLAVTALGLLPWLFFARLPQRSLTRPSAGTAALLGWWLLPIAALSLLRTQQPHYALPGLPAAALLLATQIEDASMAPRRALATLATLLGVALLSASALAPQILAARGQIDLVSSSIASDPVVRAGAAVAGLAMLGLVLWPRARGASIAWRAAAGTGVIALVAVIALGRIDRWMSPRALVTRPVIASAPRLAAPGSLRSAIRVLSGRTQVDELAERELASRLRADAGLVALVWTRDLPRLAIAPGEVEMLARGFARGRELVALRATRDSVPGSRPALDSARDLPSVP